MMATFSFFSKRCSWTYGNEPTSSRADQLIFNSSCTTVYQVWKTSVITTSTPIPLVFTHTLLSTWVIQGPTISELPNSYGEFTLTKKSCCCTRFRDTFTGRIQQRLHSLIRSRARWPRLRLNRTCHLNWKSSSNGKIWRSFYFDWAVDEAHVCNFPNLLTLFYQLFRLKSTLRWLQFDDH